MAPKRGRPKGSGAGSKKETKDGLAVGDQAPEFDLEIDTSSSEAKKTLKLQDIVGETGAIVFFYPKANTGGCTTQALGFKTNASKLEEHGYKVFGMSADKPKAQASWKAKYDFPYTLISDPTYEVLQAFGVAKGTSVSRSHVVIDKGGKIKDIRIDIKPKDSYEEALKTVAAGETAIEPNTDEIDTKNLEENKTAEAPGEDEESKKAEPAPKRKRGRPRKSAV